MSSRTVSLLAACCWLVGCPAGPPDPCAQAKDQITASCCEPPPDSGNLSTVQIPTACECGDPDAASGKVECKPAGFVAQPCVTKAELEANGPVAKGAPSDVTTEQETGVPPGTSASCLQALGAAQASCGEEVELACPEIASASVLPVCEGLQALAKNFSCSPRFERVSSVTPEVEGKIHQGFSNDPTGTGWTPKPGQPPPGTPVHIPPEFSRPGVSKEEVGELRLEIPGNFLRHHLVQAALRSTIEQQLAKLPGFSCDPASLSCTVDTMNVADLSAPITQALAGANISVEVEKNAEGYKLSELSWSSKHDYMEFRAWFTGNIQVRQDHGLSFNLRDRGHFSLAPLHAPRDENGYATKLAKLDSRVSYLDRAMLLYDLSEVDCNYLRNATFRDEPLANRYLTFSGVYNCECGPERARNFCVADVYPRKINVVNDRPGQVIVQPTWLDPILSGVHPVTLLWVAEGAKRHFVYCAGNQPKDLTIDLAPAEAEPSTSVTLEAKLTDWAELRLDPPAQQRLYAAVMSSTCNGRFAQRLALGDKKKIDFGSLSAEAAKHVNSAAGASFTGEARLPRIVATPSFGVVIFDFDLGVEAEKYFKGWKKIIGWIVKWILKLFSALATAIATAAEIVFTGDSYVDFGTQTFLIQPIASHQTQLEPLKGSTVQVAKPRIDLGLRRIATNIPDIEVVPMDPKPTWTNSACNFADTSGWPGWALKLITCPLEVTLNLAKLAVAPIISFLKSFGNLVIDLLKDVNGQVAKEYVSSVAKLEDDNNLGQLVATSVRSVLLLPYYLEAGGKPGDAPVEMGFDSSFGLLPAEEQAKKMSGTLPPPFGALCLLAPQSNAACLLARVFLGSAFFTTDHQLEILRMGAKTHYRSMQDFQRPLTPITKSDYVTDGLSWDMPPVRYCVGGDTPPGSFPYEGQLFGKVWSSGKTYLQLLGTSALDLLTDLDEIDTSTAGEWVPLDWRAQCAMFADLRVRSNFSLRGGGPVTPHPVYAELAVRPTKRTNFLVNEVFVCRDDAHCDPGLEPAAGSAPDGSGMPIRIRERARLAACSLAGDVWYRVCSPVTGCGQELYNNLLVSATGSPAPAELGWLVSSLASKAGYPDVAAIANEVIDLLGSCSGRLEAHGFEIDSTRPSV